MYVVGPAVARMRPSASPNGRLSRGMIEGDLFVDCTGFAVLLIGKAMGVPFRSCSDVPFCETALAMQVPYDAPDAPIASHTISTARSAGWIWDIGLPLHCIGRRQRPRQSAPWHRAVRMGDGKLLGRSGPHRFDAAAQPIAAGIAGVRIVERVARADTPAGDTGAVQPVVRADAAFRREPLPRRLVTPGRARVTEKGARSVGLERCRRLRS